VLCNLNLEIINTDLKFRIRNSAGTKFSCLQCGKNLNPRNLKSGSIVHYLFVVLARTTKNESKMWENLKSRDLRSGLYCNTFHSVNRKHKSALGKKIRRG
jgi:hypothetical protein